METETDLNAFERIMLQHQRQVYGTAFRLLGSREDAQDVAQEVFLRLYRHWGRLPEGVDFSPWLYRVTVNVCYDQYRRRRPQAELDDETPAAGPGPEDRAGDAERRRILNRLLRRLSRKERSAVVLRDLEGLSTEDVASILGCSVGTVRSQISIARLKLRQWIEHHGRARS